MNKKSILLVLLLVFGLQTATAISGKYLGMYYLVSSITHDEQNVYLGTMNGLVVMDKETEGQTLYSWGDSYFKESAVYSLTLHDGVLWMGREFCKFSSFRDGVFTNYQMKIPALNWPDFYEFPVSSFAFEADEDLMYISESDAFAPIQNGEIQQGYKVPTILSEGSIEDMQFDQNGTLWIVSSSTGYGYGANNNGLCRYTKEGGLDFFLQNYEDSDIPIVNDKSYIQSCCLEIGSDGHVWIGAPGGYLLEYDGEAFHCYQTGIPTWPAWQNMIKDLKFDDEGVLWSISSKGQLISFDGETFVTHQLELGDEVCDCLDIDGSNIYVGTNKRLICYNNGEQRNIELLTTTTGINEGSIANSTVTDYFDLQGRRLSGKPQHGVYIQDGKKVVIK